MEKFSSASLFALRAELASCPFDLKRASPIVGCDKVEPKILMPRCLPVNGQAINAKRGESAVEAPVSFFLRVQKSCSFVKAIIDRLVVPRFPTHRRNAVLIKAIAIPCMTSAYLVRSMILSISFLAVGDKMIRWEISRWAE